MCGIVGLFLKDKRLHPDLGSMLTTMLITMTNRGPDSAGIAIYGSGCEEKCKLTIQSDNPSNDFKILADNLEKTIGRDVSIFKKDTHAVLSLPTCSIGKVRGLIAKQNTSIRVMSCGNSIEIYKEVGLPSDVVRRFHIETMAGSHGIGHTRMATESEVNTIGAHPFSTGDDQCLVHNGSLSNHNRMRLNLVRKGAKIDTDNDSEVAAAYLTLQMQQGLTLSEALKRSLVDLDGFFTFVVGTKYGFGVLRDPIACKPAVMAETDQYVAFGSEYRALVNLPQIDNARVWEPEPATVYFWTH